VERSSFAGDAIMAVFNAPTRQPDHALRAARSTLALQSAIEAVPIAGARPRFRVGLNTGAALAGNIGSKEMRNVTVIGDATNVAERLQTFAQAGQVVIGQRTYEELGSCAQVITLGLAGHELALVPAIDDDADADRAQARLLDVHQRCELVTRPFEVVIAAMMVSGPEL
jgi:class 3 adenylate cyclase